LFLHYIIFFIKFDKPNKTKPMKKIIFFSPFLLTLMFLLNACSNNNSEKTTIQSDNSSKKEQIIKSGTFNLDTEKSNIEWLGKKLTGSHNGNIKAQKGMIQVDEKGNITAGNFILDMSTINCTDLEGESKQGLEEHLNNADFFNTTEFPIASFEISKVKSDTIFGILTIKNISNEIQFNYKKIGELSYEADIIIDRTQFNIKYASKTFIPDIGDRFIYDDFEIKLNPITFN